MITGVILDICNMSVTWMCMVDGEDNPELIEKVQIDNKNQTESQKKIKELEARKKQAEEEEKNLIENFSQEIGQSVKDTEKIWGYLKRYALIGMVTGVPGIALTCLYDKWKENAMAKELKELNQKVIASQNYTENYQKNIKNMKNSFVKYTILMSFKEILENQVIFLK